MIAKTVAALHQLREQLRRRLGAAADHEEGAAVAARLQERRHGARVDLVGPVIERNGDAGTGARRRDRQDGAREQTAAEQEHPRCHGHQQHQRDRPQRPPGHVVPCHHARHDHHRRHDGTAEEQARPGPASDHRRHDS
jgi:hypothetical protein